MIFLAVMAVPVVASPCWACSCASTGDAQADRERQARAADLIFTGIAKNVWIKDNNNDYSGDETRLARFRVRKTYKGHPGRWVTISTAQQGSVCGYPFKEGKRYTVFAYGSNVDGFDTNSCSGTKRGRINPENYGLDD